MGASLIPPPRLSAKALALKKQCGHWAFCQSSVQKWKSGEGRKSELWLPPFFLGKKGHLGSQLRPDCLGVSFGIVKGDCEFLGKILNFSVSQFLHMYKRNQKIPLFY